MLYGDKNKGVIMREEWRDVVGYEGYYIVSNTGTIKRLRTRWNGVDRNGKAIVKYTKEKTPTVRLSHKGYPTIDLCCRCTKKNVRVHRIVAQSFLDNYSEKLVVDHVDMNKLNNNVSNLEMVTNAENLRRSHLYGSHKRKHGRPMLKGRVLTQMKAKLIKELYHSEINKTIAANMPKPFDQRWLARCFKCSQNTIMQIVNNKSVYEPI